MKLEKMKNELTKCKNDIIYFMNKYCVIMTDNGPKNIILREHQINIIKKYESFYKNRRLV